MKDNTARNFTIFIAIYILFMGFITGYGVGRRLPGAEVKDTAWKSTTQY